MNKFRSYWLPKYNGKVAINYSFQGISKDICYKNEFNSLSIAITEDQKSLFIRVFQYISSVFDISFNEVANHNDADLFIGQTLEKASSDNYIEYKLAYPVLDKVNLIINGFNLNSSKIKYYPNYSAIVILKEITYILGLLIKNENKMEFIYDTVSNIKLDEEYSLKYSDMVVDLLSSRYPINKNYLKLAKSTSTNLDQENLEIISEETLDIIKDGNQLEVKKLIDSGFKINKRYKRAEYYRCHSSAIEYPLGEAVCFRNLEATQVLIEAGAKINLIRSCYTPLSDVCQRSRDDDEENENNLRLAKMLLAAGADPNFYCCNSFYGIPLIDAAKSNNKEIVELLLDSGADINVKNIDGNSTIYEASIIGAKEITKLLYDKGAEVDLVTAIFLDLREQVIEFIAKNSTEKNKIILSELLNSAVSNNNLVLATNIIKYKKYGLVIERKTFIKAVDCCDIEIIKLLIDNGANLETTNEKQETALHIAAGHKHNEKIMKLLLNSGLNPNIQDEDGYTAFHRALLNNRNDLVNLLIKYGADITIKDKKGNTAFHLIADKNQLIKYCHILKNSGINIDALNNNGDTMLIKAILNQTNPLIVEYYKECGGVFSESGTYCRSPRYLTPPFTKTFDPLG